MMQGDQPGPVRPRLQQRLVPDLRLRPGVGEQQTTGAAVHLGKHLRQHASGPCALPRESARCSAESRYRRCSSLTTLPLHGGPRFAQGARPAAHAVDCPGLPKGPIRSGPDSSASVAPTPVAAARRACCRSARAIHRPPPCSSVENADLGVGAGEQQGQAFGRRDQGGGQTPPLFRPFAAAGIARAQAHAPGDLQIPQRGFKRSRSVSRQRRAWA
jgi:hypothetical protein